MNTEIIKTNKPHKFRLTLADKINLKEPNKNMTMTNLRIYYTCKNTKTAYKNNKFKISAPTWNDEFGLPDGSYSIVDIQYHFGYIIKKLETMADNPPVQIYVNNIKNRIAFNIKTGYKLELLSSETMRLLESANKDIDQDKDGEDVPKLESVEVVLVLVNTTFLKRSSMGTWGDQVKNHKINNPNFLNY